MSAGGITESYERFKIGLGGNALSGPACLALIQPLLARPATALKKLAGALPSQVSPSLSAGLRFMRKYLQVLAGDKISALNEFLRARFWSRKYRDFCRITPRSRSKKMAKTSVLLRDADRRSAWSFSSRIFLRRPLQSRALTQCVPHLLQPQVATAADAEINGPPASTCRPWACALSRNLSFVISVLLYAERELPYSR